MEPLARALRFKSPPRLTQGRLKFLGLNLDFSIARAVPRILACDTLSRWR